MRTSRAVQMKEEPCDNCRLQPGIWFRCNNQRTGACEIQKSLNSEDLRGALLGIFLPDAAILPDTGTLGGNASAVDS